MDNQKVATALRELRESAGVGVREMARRLGVSLNTYTHYENPNRFKDPYLPMAWAIRVADALEQDGVDRERVLNLAGSEHLAELAGLDERISLLSQRRRELLVQLLEDLEAAEASDLARRETGAADGG